MSTINFSDTTPAAASGFANVKFQSDGSGNVSAYATVGTWQTYTPTVSSTGGMVVTTTTLKTAEFLRTGPVCYVAYHADLTLSGTASNVINISLPVPNLGGLMPMSAQGLPQGQSFQLLMTLINVGSVVAVQLSGLGAFPLGLTTVRLTGFYHC